MTSRSTDRSLSARLRSGRLLNRRTLLALGVGTAATVAHFLGKPPVLDIPPHQDDFGDRLAKKAHGYTDPRQLAGVGFGEQSHWAQPWRAYLETPSAATFLDGLGLNLNLPAAVDPDLALTMLARAGIARVRVEFGWSTLAYPDDTQLANPAALAALLGRVRAHGLRPLLLLNANQGVPCPCAMFSRTVAQAAPAGATTLTLSDTSGLVPGYSGLSNLTDYWAAEALVTAVAGPTVTLSKPLPQPLAAGQSVPMATLKYRPFGPPGSADWAATSAGWQRYVATIVAFAHAQCGAGGFDLEVWNELTFGSAFLSINNYYSPALVAYDAEAIWRHDLIAATASALAALPAGQLAGVGVGNGFANTQPWAAASQQPAPVSALCKHPYSGRSRYPQDEPHGTPLTAQLSPDPRPYVPHYNALFPEYYGTVLQTETILRDAAPLTTSVYGVAHGRNARTLGGQVAPVSLWITEVNINPAEDNAAVSAARAWTLKAKAAARFACFYLNKGVTQLHFYAAVGGDTGYGMLQENFLAYAQQPGASYPQDEAAYLSPPLAVLGRIAARLGQGLNRYAPPSSGLVVRGVSDTHNAQIFAGDGTAAHPSLYHRDVLTVLPYVVNEQRLVVAYYVMTRDITQDLAAEPFRLDLEGLAGETAAVSVYDPLADAAVGVSVVERRATGLALQLQASDYPYLLTIDHAGKR